MHINKDIKYEIFLHNFNIIKINDIYYCMLKLREYCTLYRFHCSHKVCKYEKVYKILILAKLRNYYTNSYYVHKALKYEKVYKMLTLLK